MNLCIVYHANSMVAILAGGEIAADKSLKIGTRMILNNKSRSYLEEAYENLFGGPEFVLELHRQAADNNVPSELDILFFLSADKEFFFVATAGLSMRELVGMHPRIELIAQISSTVTKEDLLSFARDLAEFAVLPFRLRDSLETKQIIYDTRLSMFSKMDCLLITEWSPTNHDANKRDLPSPTLLRITPLFRKEADVLREIGLNDVFFENFSGRLSDPDREPIDFRDVLAPGTGELEKEVESMRDDSIYKVVQDVWAEIERWYKANAPGLLDLLSEGADDDEVTRFENAGNLSLPEDYRASIQIHNGGGFIHNFIYLSLEESHAEWQRLKRTHERPDNKENRILKDEGLTTSHTESPKWVPIAEHKAGIVICLDMEPQVNGSIGNIIRFDYEEGPSTTKYKSFLDWLRGYRDDLMQGQYEIDSYGFLNPKR